MKISILQCPTAFPYGEARKEKCLEEFAVPRVAAARRESGVNDLPAQPSLGGFTHDKRGNHHPKAHPQCQCCGCPCKRQGGTNELLDDNVMHALESLEDGH